MNSASIPIFPAISPASSMAVSEKSTPVTFAPSLPQLRVSSPKWHWRCRRLFPETSPRALSSRLWRLFLPARNPVRSYSMLFAWTPTSSFQRLRFVL